MDRISMDRRSFLTAAGGGAAALTLAGRPGRAGRPAPSSVPCSYL